MAPDAIDLCWIDGALVPVSRPVVRADDSAYSEGRGCYTSVRIASGCPRFADRHVERLQSGAKRLDLGEVRADSIRRALSELADAALRDGEGVIRLQVSRDAEGATHLLGIARALGADPAEWTAISVEIPHDGASLARGAKVTSRLTLSLAADAARAAGAQEAILFDAAGRLVEGARTNLLVATRRGALWTPPIESGAVSGIARAIALERIAAIEVCEIARPALLDATELIAINSVRGARPITRLDGRAIGDGRPGPWTARLAEALASDG